jgi:predicted small lipoprotein YifL
MKGASWLLAGGAALLLAGCGQKGALYLPDKNAEVVTTPATPAPSTPATAAPQRPTDKNDDSQTPK